MKRTRFRPKLTKAQKAVVPNMMQALVEAEARTAEECAERLKGEGRGG
jgi:hypothetical protein